MKTINVFPDMCEGAHHSLSAGHFYVKFLKVKFQEILRFSVPSTNISLQLYTLKL